MSNIPWNEMIKGLFVLTLIIICIIAMGSIPPNSLGVPNSVQTIDINTSSAGNTLLASGVANQNIYVTHIHVMAGGTTSFSLVYGTTATLPCDTGTVTLDGPEALIAQTGYAAGSGLGAVDVIPTGKDLCYNNSSAVQIGGAASLSTY